MAACAGARRDRRGAGGVGRLLGAGDVPPATAALRAARRGQPHGGAASGHAPGSHRLIGCRVDSSHLPQWRQGPALFGRAGSRRVMGFRLNVRKRVPPGRTSSPAVVQQGGPSMTTDRRVRVLTADGHPLYREAMTNAIKDWPELELVAEAADGRRALEAINSEEPDVALVESNLPGLTGEQVLNAVGRDGLDTRVLLISAEPASGDVYQAIANGAAGYLTKDAEAREICDAITAVARGQTIVAPDLQAGMAGEIRMRSVDERPFLSDREYQVLRLIAGGLTAPEIGRSIHLSTATVKTHLQHIEPIAQGVDTIPVAHGDRRLSGVFVEQVLHRADLVVERLLRPVAALVQLENRVHARDALLERHGVQ